MKKPSFKPDFLIIPFPIYQDKRLEGLDMITFAVIYNYENMMLGKCTASNASIAEMTGGTNVRSISNCLDRLEKAGYIDRFYKDEQKRNRTEIRTTLSFKKLNKPSAVWNTRDSNLDDTSDSSLDEQNKNKYNNNTKHNPDRSPEEEKEIADAIDFFKEVNPTYKRLFGLPNQREAANRLIKEFGFAKVSAIIKFLPKSNAVRYAPTITTPIQLEQKMGELMAWSNKQKNNGKQGKGMVDANEPN